MSRREIVSFLAFAALLIAGCSSGRPRKVVQAPVAVPPRYSSDVGPIARLDHTQLFVTRLNTSSRYRILNTASKLYLGDEADRALEVFGTPPRSYDVTDLPDGWKEQGFSAAGWETSDEGFGAVLQQGRVALVVFSVDHAAPSLFERLVADYGDDLALRPASIAGRRATYCFWSTDDQTLMICRTETHSGTTVTVALGANPLMEALRMSIGRAKEDLKDSEELFRTSATIQNAE